MVQALQVVLLLVHTLLRHVGVGVALLEVCRGRIEGGRQGSQRRDELMRVALVESVERGSRIRCCGARLCGGTCRPPVLLISHLRAKSTTAPPPPAQSTGKIDRSNLALLIGLFPASAVHPDSKQWREGEGNLGANAPCQKGKHRDRPPVYPNPDYPSIRSVGVRSGEGEEAQRAEGVEGRGRGRRRREEGISAVRRG